VYDWSDDEEDLEGHGAAYFDRASGWWVAEFDAEGVRYVPKKDRTPVDRFRCVSCRSEIVHLASRHLQQSRGYETVWSGGRCPTCGTRIDAPSLPPDSGAQYPAYPRNERP